MNNKKVTSNKKRKFDGENNEPNRKKRKFNKSNKRCSKNKFNTLCESNKLLQRQNNKLLEENKKLIKERDEGKKEVNIHKKEANNWKSQFLKLHEQLTQITNHGNNVHKSMDDQQANNKNKSKNTLTSIIVNKPRNFMKSSTADTDTADTADTCTSDNTYDTIRARLFEMGYDRDKVLNRISLYNGSGETPQFVFNQLINTFTPDTAIANNYNLRKKTSTIANNKINNINIESTDNMSDDNHTLSSNEESTQNKNKNKNKNGNGNKNKMKVITIKNCGEYVDFEHSFHFSVHCHICQKHFDNYDEYCNDMKKHYETDPTKTWKQCDFGCKIDPKKPFFPDTSVFISHIATHTNDKPYKCDVIMNGKKCESTSGQRKNIKGHWKLHFNKIQKNHKKQTKKAKKKQTTLKVQKEKNKKKIQTLNTKKIQKEKVQKEKVQKEKVQKEKNKKQIRTLNTKKIKQNKRMYKKRAPFIPNPDFEKSCYVSINCHLCNKHFEDSNILNYKNHMKEHYDKDPLKTWLKCDVCSRGQNGDVVFGNYTGFICHIASHTENYPFKCNKCQHVAGTKSNLKRHWDSKHSKNYRNNRINIGYKKIYKNNDCSSESESCSYSSSCFSSSSYYSSSSESESELSEIEIENEFENSYLVAVDCHICKKHFDDFGKYKTHIKKHYVNDPNKKWLECDFGCYKKNTRIPIRLSSSSNFMLHITTHTKNKPFRCNVIENGIRCRRLLTNKFRVKEHWKSNHFKQRLKDNCKMKNKKNV